MNPKPTAVTPEILLENAGWIRRIAASLLADPDRVDDILQETWVRALASPPHATDERGLRSWLAAVARNLALEQNRSEGRRARREMRAAREETVLSVRDSLERFELHRRIVDAVLALPSGEREVVVLRYFDELPPRRISERLGHSDAAVRSRLSRALRRLRQCLDREHGGDRHTWALGLIEIAIRVEGSAAHPAASSTDALTSAGLPQSWIASTILRPIAAIAVLLVVGVSGWLVVSSLDDPDPVQDVAALVPESAAPDSDIQSVGAINAVNVGALSDTTSESPDTPGNAAENVRMIPRASESTRPARLLATFVNDEASPLANVELSVLGRDDIRAMSDEHGRLELQVPLPLAEPQLLRVLDLEFPAPSAELILLARRRGMATVLYGQAVNPGETVETGIIPIGSAGAVRGRIVDSNGNAVVGASVAAIEPIGHKTEDHRAFGYRLAMGAVAGKTDARGEYSLDAIPTGFATLIAKSEATWFGYSDTIEILRSQEISAPEIVLEYAGADCFVSGHVVHADGRFAAGVIVQLSDEEGIASLGSRITDEKGAFQFLVLPEKRYALTAIHATAPSLRADGFATPGHGSIDLQLGKSMGSDIRAMAESRGTAAIRGRVLADGQPVSGATVSAHRSFSHGKPLLVSHDGFFATFEPSPTTQASTFDDGTFSMRTSLDEDYVLTVDAPGFARTEGEPFNAQYASEHRLELHNGGGLQGRVLLGDGISPASFKVGASRGDGRVLEAQLDAGGRYRFDKLTPGPWQVLRLPREDAYSRDFRPSDEMVIPWSVTIVEGKVATFDLDHSEEKRTYLSGRILLNRHPPEGWLAMHARRDATNNAPVGGNGRFLLEPLESGPATLSVGPAGQTGTGRYTFVHDVVDIEEGENRWNLDLPTGTVEIRGISGLPTLMEVIRSGSGTGNRYALYWRGEDRLRFEAAIIAQPADGIWKISHVPAGSIRLLHGPQRDIFEDTETLPAIAEFELVAGDYRVVDLDS